MLELYVFENLQERNNSKKAVIGAFIQQFTVD